MTSAIFCENKSHLWPISNRQHQVDNSFQTLGAQLVTCCFLRVMKWEARGECWSHIKGTKSSSTTLQLSFFLTHRRKWWAKPRFLEPSQARKRCKSLTEDLPVAGLLKTQQQLHLSQDKRKNGAQRLAESRIMRIFGYTSCVWCIQKRTPFCWAISHAASRGQRPQCRSQTFIDFV